MLFLIFRTKQEEEKLIYHTMCILSILTVIPALYNQPVKWHENALIQYVFLTTPLTQPQ